MARITACPEVMRFRRSVTAGLCSSAGVTLIINCAACADVSGSGSLSPRMVKISSSGAYAALVVMVRLSVGNHTASGTCGICIHDYAAILAVLMVCSF